MHGRHPHFDRQTLEGFLRNALACERSREVVRHLLTLCDECRAALSLEPGAIRPLRSASWISPESRAETSAGERPEGGALAISEVEAHRALLAGLVALPFPQQLLRVKNSLAFRSLGAVRALLEKSWSVRFNDPEQMLGYARLAVEAVERCQGDGCSTADLHDLQAIAWAKLANALRVNSEIPEAWEALGRAESLIGIGSGAPRTLGEILEVKATLLSERSRDREAEAALRLALQLFRAAGCRELVGRTLLSLGFLHSKWGDFEAEIALTQEALAILDPARNARLVMTGWHNLVHALEGVGRSREALELLTKARPMYLELGDRTTLARFQWLEGMIAESLERVEQAEGCYQEVRRAFVDLASPVDAALVSLDLAALWLKQNRHGEVLRLAGRTLTVLRGHRVQQEALAAVILLQKAAEQRELTLALVQEIGEKLEASRKSS